MPFEHRKQKVASYSTFLRRMVRYTFFCLSWIVVSIMIGTWGYHNFGNLNWLDSFYMSCMILTGMGPVAEMTSDSAKLFSSIYALYSGIAFLSMTAVFLAPLVHRLLHILHVEAEEKG